MEDLHPNSWILYCLSLFQLHFTLINDSYLPEYPGYVADDFEIKQLEGNKAAIITKRQFDREVRAIYYLNVRADDISPSDHMAHKNPGKPNSRKLFWFLYLLNRCCLQGSFLGSVIGHWRIKVRFWPIVLTVKRSYDRSMWLCMC